MSIEQLVEIVQVMVVLGKGIIVIDEFIGIIVKCFVSVGIENIEENCCVYCELLFIMLKFNEYIFGVILYDEIICQFIKDGVLFVKYMVDYGMILGIKVDKGVYLLVGCLGEMVIEGLDGLCECLQEYYKLGVCFVKWCVVINIGESILLGICIEFNVYVLVCYVVLCQECGLVLMVELEVIMDGDYDIEICYEVIEVMLCLLFDVLYQQNVLLEGIILKVLMVILGKGCDEQVDVEEVVELIVMCFKSIVLVILLGVVFLFGGQSDEQLIVYLNVMNQMGNLLWLLSFFYGCVMQQVVLKLWVKDIKVNVVKVQQMVYDCVKENGQVVLGKWNG